IFFTEELAKSKHGFCAIQLRMNLRKVHLIKNNKHKIVMELVLAKTPSTTYLYALLTTHYL
ncbi:MAG: hypothetical protein AAFO03_10355, partial [Bacteroidota bacterium]